MNPNKAVRKQGHKDECAMVTVACQGNGIIHSTTIVIAKFSPFVVISLVTIVTKHHHACTGDAAALTICVLVTLWSLNYIRFGLFWISFFHPSSR
jgi:hypothetical protein